jgi:hypothetical protein
MARASKAKRPPKIIDRRQRIKMPLDSGILQRWRDVVDIDHGTIVTCSMNCDGHMATKKS